MRHFFHVNNEKESATALDPVGPMSSESHPEKENHLTAVEGQLVVLTAWIERDVTVVLMTVAGAFKVPRISALRQHYVGVFVYYVVECWSPGTGGVLLGS